MSTQLKQFVLAAMFPNSKLSSNEKTKPQIFLTVPGSAFTNYQTNKIHQLRSRIFNLLSLKKPAIALKNSVRMYTYKMPVYS